MTIRCSRKVVTAGAGAAVLCLACANAGRPPAEAGNASASASDSTGSVATGDIDAPTRQQLLAARDAVWQAWFSNDTAHLQKLLPPAVAAGQADGTTNQWEDRRKTLDDAEQFVAGGGKLVKLEFPRTEIRLAGDVAVVFSTFEFETDRNGQQHTTRGRSTEVFVRRNGEWVNPLWYLGPRS